MKFVEFQVCFMKGDQSLADYFISYVNIKKVKTFRVNWDRTDRKYIVFNDDYKVSNNTYEIPRYIPIDKDEFKEAFGLDWDELG